MFGPDFDRLIRIMLVSLAGGMALIGLIVGLTIGWWL
jgi:hypothetical protein